MVLLPRAMKVVFATPHVHADEEEAGTHNADESMKFLNISALPVLAEVLFVHRIEMLEATRHQGA